MTHDPFFRTAIIIADRVAVFATLLTAVFAVLWDAVCGRGLGRPGAESLKLALSVLTGRAGPLPATLFALTAAVATLLSAAVSIGLFALWRRRARLDAQHLRGPKAGE